MDRDVLIMCPAALLAEAEALASQFPGGAGTFQRGVSDADAKGEPTHYLGSGHVHPDMAAAFEADPRFTVRDNAAPAEVEPEATPAPTRAPVKGEVVQVREAVALAPADLRVASKRLYFTEPKK